MNIRTEEECVKICKLLKVGDKVRIKKRELKERDCYAWYIDGMTYYENQIATIVQINIVEGYVKLDIDEGRCNWSPDMFDIIPKVNTVIINADGINISNGNIIQSINKDNSYLITKNGECIFESDENGIFVNSKIFTKTNIDYSIIEKAEVIMKTLKTTNANYNEYDAVPISNNLIKTMIEILQAIVTTNSNDNN